MEATVIEQEGRQLSEAEAARLAELERIVDDAICSVRGGLLAIGPALREIQQSRLYRQSHATFEDYCRCRFGLRKSHVYRLLEAETVMANLLSPPVSDGGKVGNDLHEL